MKKRIITAAFVAAIAIFAGTTVYNAQKPEAMSDIALANVEALAQHEWGTTAECKYQITSKCYKFRYDSPWDPGTMIREDDMVYAN